LNELLGGCVGPNGMKRYRSVEIVDYYQTQSESSRMNHRPFNYVRLTISEGDFKV